MFAEEFPNWGFRNSKISIDDLDQGNRIISDKVGNVAPFPYLRLGIKQDFLVKVRKPFS